MQKTYFLCVAASAFWAVTAFAQSINLMDRKGPRPVTTDGIPHIQIDVEAVPELSAELLRRVSNIEGIQLRGTVVGRSGSTGFWLDESIELAHPDGVIRGREFAHLHPDGSLHATLSPGAAVKAVDAAWATPHPWAAQKSGLEGFVMLYTPTSEQQLEVVIELIRESYKYITGVEPRLKQQ